MMNINRRKTKCLHNGFSLIELVITVAIIGILVSIAYPSYQDSIIKSRRGDAEGKLMSFANVMERYYTQCNTYPTAVSATSCPAPIPVIDPNHTLYYQLSSLTSINGSTYQSKAVPKGTQIADVLGTLTLDQAGNRSCMTGTVITANCW